VPLAAVMPEEVGKFVELKEHCCSAVLEVRLATPGSQPI
jgi:hypothetical protein